MCKFHVGERSKKGILQTSKIFFSIVHFFACAMHTILCKANKREAVPIKFRGSCL